MDRGIHYKFVVNRVVTLLKGKLLEESFLSYVPNSWVLSIKSNFWVPHNLFLTFWCFYSYVDTLEGILICVVIGEGWNDIH
jgi:hypothetical protein